MNKVDLYLKLPLKVRENLLVLANNRKIRDIKIKKKEMIQYCEKDRYKNKWGQYKKEQMSWNKAFRNMMWKTKDGLEEAKYFYLDNINIIKTKTSNSKDIITICLVKDDLKRMKEFISHYRKMGIKKFAIIDNDSKDGTFEFLQEQEDVDLFQIKEKYSTIRRQSWINRVISYYGFNNWYLIVDSDELLVYNEMETYNIQKLVKYNSEKNIKRCKAIMVDMYPEKFMMEKKLEREYFSVFKYFDTDTYYKVNNKYFEQISGGMRERIFKQEDNQFKIFLIKYPLIYFEEGDIQYNSHYSYPFYKNFKKELNLALLHYKFLPEDFKRIQKIVEEKNFASGSKEYKRYLEIYEKDKKMSFLYQGSQVYETSEDLYSIDKMKKIIWK